MVEKPQLKAKPNRPSKTNQNSGQKGSGNKGSGGGGRPPRNKDRSQSSGGNPNQLPSPWLNPDNEPKPHTSASFVEYLRWMRPADHDYKDATKTQILQMATENKNYDSYLNNRNERIKLIAKQGEVFEVNCPWRIRVGGNKGPENILLPAFDAQGIPYIPSSTLRGVARTQAIREIMAAKNCDWKKAEADQIIYQHFGSLDAPTKNQAGKIVFLDAYPIAGKCTVEMDMANNIWSWEGNDLKYSPNPNTFLSLKDTCFLIGLRLVTGENNQQLLKQVKDWLLAGLANGAGSQVNTGYGQLLGQGSPKPQGEFLNLKFALEGQLIHGYQKFSNLRDPYKKDRDGNYKLSKDGKLQGDGKAQAEVRPTAFKSMLRYWFRVFALGQISTENAKDLEAIIFGGINPQKLGLLKIQIEELEAEYEDDQEGILRVSYSSSVQQHQKDILRDFTHSLTWLMFYLGGVGQGARRAKYDRPRTPKIRGSKLYVLQSLPKELFLIPSQAEIFAERLQQKLSDFQEKLSLLAHEFNLNNQSRKQDCSDFIWHEILDKNCQIFVVPAKQSTKPYALYLLHQQFHKLEDEMRTLKNNNCRRESKEKYSEMKNLCGGTDTDFFFLNNQKIERKIKPSPIWVRDLEKFQVVTVFGATASPRRDYVQALQNAGAVQVFPFQ